MRVLVLAERLGAGVAERRLCTTAVECPAVSSGVAHLPGQNRVRR